MAYRGEKSCGICGAQTVSVCPRCGRGVCNAHTLLALLEGRSAGEVRAGQRLAKRLGGPGVCVDCVAEETEAARGPFVEIFRSTDPLQAQMIAESLLDEGFDARALGTTGAALIGAGQHIFEQRIEVPEVQADDARALIEALLDGSGGVDEVELAERARETADAAGASGEPPTATPQCAPRRRAVAAGVVFLFPGGAHLYAWRPITGLILAAVWVVGLVLLLQQQLRFGGTLIAAVWGQDLIGGQAAVSAHNRGERRTRAAQLLDGMLAAVISVAIAALLGR